MSNKFKIGDRVTIINSNIKGKVGTINYHDDKEEYVITCEKSGSNYYRYGERLKHAEIETPHHKYPREMNKQHLIGFKDGQEVRVEPNGVCTMSNNNLGVIVSTPKADKTDPSHYKNQSIEVWEMMIRIWGKEKFIAFCEMNAFKYRLRLGSKEGESIEDDIKKAQWYEQRANELR